MKFLELLLAAFLLTITSFIPTRENNDNGCQTIVDSATALNQTSSFAVNFKPTIKDNERNLRLDKWFQKLSFKELTCLLDNENISLKAIGFLYAAGFHSDSLLKNYSALLSDTTSIQLYMADGSKSPTMKLGELLSTMTQKLKEDEYNLAKRPKIEENVATFIKEYATYPKTYKPYSFPDFSMGSDNAGLSGFKITHDYEIKNNEGKNVRVVSAFVFDKNLKINVIEKDSSSYISAYPPKLDYWLKEFGRKLTKSDSLNLGLR